VKGRSRWCSSAVRVKTGELQHSKAANRVGVMRGRQRRAWTWSGGCDGNDMRGGVCSAAYLPKQRGKMGRRWGPARWLLCRSRRDVAGRGGGLTPARHGHGGGGWRCRLVQRQGCALAAPRGRGPVALGWLESTVPFPI
jgi:hypothetical protein